jgi:hypothetical protein
MPANKKSVRLSRDFVRDLVKSYIGRMDIESSPGMTRSLKSIPHRTARPRMFA